MASICAHRARCSKLIICLLATYVFKACAVICRKATFTISVSAVMLPDANFLSSRCQSPSSRAQKLHFCALLASRTPIFRPFEHKIGVLVLFWPSEPSFSGFSSRKSGFLCSGARLSFGSGGFYLVFSRLLFAYPTFMSYFC